MQQPPVAADNDPEAPSQRKKVSEPRFDQCDTRCHRKSQSEIDLLCVVDVVCDERQERIKTACRQT
jgi:hypothetical protein